MVPSTDYCYNRPIDWLINIVAKIDVDVVIQHQQQPAAAVLEKTMLRWKRQSSISLLDYAVVFGRQKVGPNHDVWQPCSISNRVGDGISFLVRGAWRASVACSLSKRWIGWLESDTLRMRSWLIPHPGTVATIPPRPLRSPHPDVDGSSLLIDQSTNETIPFVAAYSPLIRLPRP